SRTSISPSPRYTAAGIRTAPIRGTIRAPVTLSPHCGKPAARNEEAADPKAGGSKRSACATSDNADVLRFVTLAAGRHVDLDVLTLFEGLVALALNVRVVDENVLLAFERDEAEALLGVEEFHCSC